MSKSTFPKVIFPELATLVDKPPAGDDWLHEIKLDGYRILAFKDKNNVELVSRNQNNWSKQFPNVYQALLKLPIQRVIFDGEVVVLEENQHSNFQLLQNSIKENQNVKFIYYIFDIIYYDEYNLMSLPLIKRKDILQHLITVDAPVLRYSDYVVGSGDKVFAKSCELGLEGIVSKKMASLYVQSRTREWLKIKSIQSQEFIIGGFTKPKGARQYFGSLLIGTYNKNQQLIYNGHVGTGFTEASLKEVYQLLIRNKTDVMPFTTRPPNSRQVMWVKPKLVAMIKFSAWTNEKILRQPSFMGLRSDKSPRSIMKETKMAVKKLTTKKTKTAPKYSLTHADKVLYPESGITKLQLAEYYEAIHDWILPYVINRPLTLVRCPESYKQCFYQKHLTEAMPAHLHGVRIKEKHATDTYIYIKDKGGLISLVQLGTLEIHPWGCHIKKIEYPDMMIFDLDPANNVQWKEIVATAFLLKDFFSAFNLTSFVKTTGGKGLHVVVPIKPEYDWEMIKKLTRLIAEWIVKENPHKYTSNMRKTQRHNKIYIDYLRNQRGATAIAPYSTRAKPHATVATPVAWDELTHNALDTLFTIKDIPDRLAKLKHDPWEEFFSLKQSLKKIFKFNKDE